MRVTFQEIALYGKKSVACAGGCGRRLGRSQKFYQTLNPFNKLPDGTLKGREDIYVELLAQIKKWKLLPDICKHCPTEIASLDAETTEMELEETLADMDRIDEWELLAELERQDRERAGE